MLLHLMYDEKVIDRTIRLFESELPGQNLYVIFGETPFRHVTPGERIISAREYRPEKHPAATAVVIHSLSPRKIAFVEAYCPPPVPVYWIIWGKDLYNKLLAPKGFRMYDRTGSYYTPARRIAAPLRRFKYRLRAARTMRFVRSRVTCLVTDITHNDYDVFARYYPEIRQIAHAEFFYYPIDEILGPELLGAQVTGRNILIGNSNSLTNNHEYAFRYLSGLQLGGRRIIVPLSYNGNPEYRDTVLAAGKRIFGEGFMPLVEFMPLAEYNRLMQSASVAIYGNWRQEAIGNIIIALYLGAKVFIAARNPVYAWAKELGLDVYELETIDQQALDTPLTDAQRLRNRTILSERFNRAHFLETVHSVFGPKA